MISLDKKYQLKRGDEVRLMMVDGEGAFPVIGAYRDGDLGGWYPGSWTKEGLWAGRYPGPTDLVEVKELKTEWLNIYSTYIDRYPTEERAREICTGNILARVKIEYLEGQGLGG